MSVDTDTSADELGRALSALIGASQAIPDLLETWRAVDAWHARERAYRADEGDDLDTVPIGDPMVFASKVNSSLLRSLTRLGLQWQQLVSRRLPLIRQRLDDYRAEDDPLPERRMKLLDELRMYLFELGELAADHGHALRQDLDQFQWELFPDDPALPDTTADHSSRRNRTVPYRLERKGSRSSASSAQQVIQKLRLESEIKRLDRAMKAWVDQADPNVRSMLKWQFESDAKYFRPMTVFSCHRAMSDAAIPDSLITTAQVVEMFHNVSLIIDDIVDRSPERRGKATVQQKFGPLRAYMVSGYIMTEGYDILAKQVLNEQRDDWIQPPDDLAALLYDHALKNPRLPDGSFHSKALDQTGLTSQTTRAQIQLRGPVRFDQRLFSELIRRLAVAECVQWASRKQPLGLADWHYLAREDTGSMFEICACLGARSQRLRRFGRLLGMLYHGCDDVADVRNAQGLGGGGNEDLEEGILTLPAALAITVPQISDLFCKPTRSRAEKRQLLAAYKARLPEAEKELDKLADMAREEARASSSAPEYLIALVDHTRPLSAL